MAKILTQPMCPSNVDKENVEYYSVIKKNEILSCTKMSEIKEQYIKENKKKTSSTCSLSNVEVKP
jgi:hypothetical protein